MIQFDCITKPDLEKSHIWIRFSGFHSFFFGFILYNIQGVCFIVFGCERGGEMKVFYHKWD